MQLSSLEVVSRDVGLMSKLIYDVVIHTAPAVLGLVLRFHRQWCSIQPEQSRRPAAAAAAESWSCGIGTLRSLYRSVRSVSYCPLTLSLYCHDHYHRR